MNTTPDTALTPLLEKATGGGDWQVDGVYVRASNGRAVAYVGDDAQDAALITASVRAIRWAHSEAGVEAIALVISQVAWGNQTDSPMDGDRQVARSIVAALAKAGVGG